MVRHGSASRSARAACERSLAGRVFALLLVSYLYFFQGGGWNPNSRLDLTRAIAERGTLAIDAYRSNTGDWARHGGHYYTNKAPGLSLLAVPPFLVASRLAARLATGERLRLTLAAYLTNAVVNALPAALLGVLLFHALGRLGVASPGARAGLALAFGLGTPAFPYATAFYAHQPAAVAGFAAGAALLAARDAARPRTLAALAGAAGGLAVLLEHSSVLAVAALAAVALADARDRRLLPWFVLGGLPAAALLAGYQSVAFGHPLATGFAHQNPGIEVRVDGRLFGLPSLERAAGLLLLPYRGLLFASPLFVFAPFGYAALRRADARAAALCLAVPLAFLLFFASYHAWHGGFSAGPRYLVPALPFLFVPAALAMQRLPAAAAALGVLSVGIALAITTVSVELPRDVERPLFETLLPLLAAGHVSVNTLGFDDRKPALPWVNDASSFNLGELLFPHTTASLLPLLAAWCLLGLSLWRSARTGQGSDSSRRRA